MEHQKILNLLNLNIVNDNSQGNYNVANEITYNREVIKSSLCDYNDVYIVVRGDITVTAAPETQVSFEDCAPFIKCITNNDKTIIDDAEDLDLVIPMYNLIEYNSNCCETTGTFWLYSKDEATNFNADLPTTNNSESIKYNAKLFGNTDAGNANGILKDATINVPLK